METEELIKNPIKLRKLLPEGYINNLDSNLRLFCRTIKANLREENYEIFAITGYAGYGKSTLGAIMGGLTDENYSFWKNINFIPVSREIEEGYLNLPQYSFFHIDEASRSVHKHKWYEKTQQKLAELYDTEREGHYICTCLIMPRFQNFTENFRNFFIKYWVNVIARGVAIVYRRDEDKDTKDPWNIEENFRNKKTWWRGKKIYERSVSDVIRMEQKTSNYWFYFTFPELPEETWKYYKALKVQSRIDIRNKKDVIELESYKDKVERLKLDRWKKLIGLRNLGKTYADIGVEMGMSPQNVRLNIRQIEAYNRIKGSIDGLMLNSTNSNDIIYNQDKDDKKNESHKDFDII